MRTFGCNQFTLWRGVREKSSARTNVYKLFTKVKMGGTYERNHYHDNHLHYGADHCIGADEEVEEVSR
jgi:hypothetical protein